jgi:hypothetical protein
MNYYSKQSQTNPIYGELVEPTRSELVESILSASSGIHLSTHPPIHPSTTSQTPNSFSNNYLHKNDPSDSAQFKQWRQPSLTGFGAPFSAISRVIREPFEDYSRQFETIGDMAYAIVKFCPS